MNPCLLLSLVLAAGAGTTGATSGPGSADAELEAGAGATAPAAGGTAPPDPAASADESPVAITTRLTPDPSSIGDVLALEVTAAYPRGITVNLPIGLDFEPLHLVNVRESEPEPTGEGLRKVFTIELQYFDVGDGQTPSFPLTYVTSDGAVQTLDVPSRMFKVEPLLANEANPERRAEDPPISIEYPNLLAETIVYTILATLLFALLAWVILRRWLRRERPEEVVPPVPPHVRAREDLNELEAEDLPREERWQEYYLRLTEIARAYVEGRFEIEALDRTTEELRRALLQAADRIAPIDPTTLVTFLQSADLVKFARAIANREEADRSMAFVREMVDQTTRPEQGPAETSVPPESREVA